MTPPNASSEGSIGARARLARLVRAARSSPQNAVGLALAGVVLVMLLVDGGRTLAVLATFALSGIRVTFELARADPGPTFLVAAAFVAKLLLALVPAVVLAVTAPSWRLPSVLFAFLILLLSLSFVRACPTVLHWVLLLVASALGAALVRKRFLRLSAGLPLIVLVVLPGAEHGAPWHDGESLRPRCDANDGERPAGLDSRWLTPHYYGVHAVTPEWILLTGETSEDGRLFGIPHAGWGSWWLRAREDGTFAFYGRSEVTGNVWTSCALGDDRWLTRAGMLVRFRPPADGPEEVERIPYPKVGFDAPDVACDARRSLVLASDLFDGRPIELAARTRGRPRRLRGATGARGGAIEIRPSDGRLLALDFHYLAVYDLDSSEVLHTTPAAAASQSLALCAIDDAVAVPDLAGRVRVFRREGEGYVFDWGVDLFAPRFAQFSPDCTHLAVTSADDVHVWIVERASRRVIRTFRVGPGLRGGDFVGPRAFAVADACTMTVLRF